jgi:hypothetical protein
LFTRNLLKLQTGATGSGLKIGPQSEPWALNFSLEK